MPTPDDTRRPSRPASRGTLPRRMGAPTSPPDAAGPILFVAREPDETLRTFLPVIALLRSQHGRACRVLFHHTPGPWARAELAALGTTIDEVALPKQALPRSLAGAPGATTLDEIARMRHARTVARAAL